MKTIIELMTALSAESNIGEGARIAMTSELAGAKNIYLAWGKEKGESLKTLNEQWKIIEDEVKPAKRAGANGFTAMYYDWLAGESRTEQEACDLIMGNESQNVRNHLTHYLNIWALCETVRQGQKVLRSISAEKVEGDPAEPKVTKPTKAKEPEFVYDAAHPFACEKSAAETLMRQKNLVAKKRDLATLLVGAEMEGPSQEGFNVILRNTKKSLKIEE